MTTALGLGTAPVLVASAPRSTLIRTWAGTSAALEAYPFPAAPLTKHHTPGGLRRQNVPQAVVATRLCEDRVSAGPHCSDASEERPSSPLAASGHLGIPGLLAASLPPPLL